jgi:trimethylamine:corrinoid methyltransferase-like protein
MSSPRRPRAAGGRAPATPSVPCAPHRRGHSIPYITRKIPCYEVLDEEGLALIERNADTILEEIGIEFREDAEALAIWKNGRRDVQGERVRMPRGMCRQLIQASAPREFTQHARNPARSVPIGGPHTVFRPGLRFPLHLQPRRGAALRAHRGLPEFRETRVPGEVAAPLRRHDLRTGGPARSTSATSTWSTAT